MSSAHGSTLPFTASVSATRSRYQNHILAQQCTTIKCFIGTTAVAEDTSRRNVPHYDLNRYNVKDTFTSYRLILIFYQTRHFQHKSSGSFSTYHFPPVSQIAFRHPDIAHIPFPTHVPVGKPQHHSRSSPCFQISIHFLPCQIVNLMLPQHLILLGMAP